jgi:hypothetical protein
MNTVEVFGAVKSYGEKKNRHQVLSGVNMSIAQGSM